MLVYSLVAILGATVDLGMLWSIAETFNGLMADSKLDRFIPSIWNCGKIGKRLFS